MAKALTKDFVLLTPQDVSEARERSNLLIDYIRNSLQNGVDFGHIFSGAKPSLFKPGAEKLAKLFRLGSRIVNQTSQIDHEKNFAYFSYTFEIYHLDTQKALAQCEGSANSRESRYSRHKIGEVINTLQKMAQKRAFVGAVILAVGASEFYTQDLEDTEPSVILKSLPTADVESDRPVESYVIKIGKRFRGRKLSEVPRKDLESFVDWLGSQSKKRNSAPTAAVREFIRHAQAYLESVH